MEGGREGREGEREERERGREGEREERERGREGRNRGKSVTKLFRAHQTTMEPSHESNSEVSLLEGLITKKLLQVSSFEGCVCVLREGFHYYITHRRIHKPLVIVLNESQRAGALL